MNEIPAGVWREVLAERGDESERRRAVRAALDCLPTDERRVLEMRFGFRGAPMEFDEIGAELGLCVECVRQKLGHALARLAALRELGSLAAPADTGDAA